jgi:hypothetical protein
VLRQLKPLQLIAARIIVGEVQERRGFGYFVPHGGTNSKSLRLRKSVFHLGKRGLWANKKVDA